MRTCRLSILWTAFVLAFAGCGGGAEDEPIDKSDNAPTQDQWDEMNKQMAQP